MGFLTKDGLTYCTCTSCTYQLAHTCIYTAEFRLNHARVCNNCRQRYIGAVHGNVLFRYLNFFSLDSTLRPTLEICLLFDPEFSSWFGRYEKKNFG